MLFIRDVRSRVYYITPDDDLDGFAMRPLIAAVLRAGIGMIQYRRRRLSDRDSVQEITEVIRLTRAARVPLIVAGRVDVALAVGAEGVHLGPEDICVAHARRLMGPSAIIGAEAASPGDARLAQQDGATYITVGPIFESTGRPGVPLGVEVLTTVRAGTGLPVCAAGGIDPERIRDVAMAGADLVAVVGAINSHSDPAAAAAEAVRVAASFAWPSAAP